MGRMEQGERVRVLLELLRLLLLAPLLMWRLRDGFPPPWSLKMVPTSSYQRVAGDKVEEPQGWLITEEGIRVLYGCTPDGLLLRFRHYDDDEQVLRHMSAPEALKAAQEGRWLIVGSEESALAAGRALAIEQLDHLLQELLA